MSQPTFEYNTPNGFPERPKFKKLAVQLIILTGFLALVIGPLVVYGGRAERARWSAASAMNLAAEGQVDLALEKLRGAVQASGNDQDLMLSLAEQLAQHNEAQEGLELCNSILEDDNNRPPKHILLRAMQIKSICQQELGKSKDALMTLKAMYPYLDQSQIRQPTRLNNLAYYRALADVELEIAAEDMLTVFSEHALRNFWFTDSGLSLEAQAIISIVQLSRKMDQELNRELGAGLLLNRKIKEQEELLYLFDRELLAIVYERIGDAFPLLSKWENAHANLRGELERTRIELAYFLALRALIAQSAEDWDRCEADRLHVQSLGYDAGILVEQLPADIVYIQTLRLASTYLDTYGYVLYRQRDFDEALRNLNLAVLAGEYQLLCLDSPLGNSSTETPRLDDSLAETELKRTLAVIHYHRMLVHRELSQQRAATKATSNREVDLEKADADRIRALGFDPEDSLLY